MPLVTSWDVIAVPPLVSNVTVYLVGVSVEPDPDSEPEEGTSILVNEPSSKLGNVPAPATVGTNDLTFDTSVKIDTLLFGEEQIKISYWEWKDLFKNINYNKIILWKKIF